MFTSKQQTYVIVETGHITTKIRFQNNEHMIIMINSILKDMANALFIKFKYPL